MANEEVNKKLSYKVSEPLIQREISKLLRDKEMKGCKGFVLSVSDDDRLNDLVTVTFVWSKTAVIIVNDYLNMLEYAIKFHIKINSAHKMVGMKRGFDRDDFVTTRASALLTFEF